MAQLHNKKNFETGLLLGQSWSFKVHKLYIIATFTHLVLKLYKNENVRYSFKATADTANKDMLCL